MAVVTGLVMSEFLTAARFQPSRAAQLKFLFGVDSEDERRGYHAWIGAMLYSTPDVLLSQTIMGAFVGTGIVVVGPLWDRQDGEWDGAHKVMVFAVNGRNLDEKFADVLWMTDRLRRNRRAEHRNGGLYSVDFSAL